MGYFSWLTSDTKESISVTSSSRSCRPVFLLQPNDEGAILEEAYEGYGEFGGVDAYIWLATKNLPAKTLKGLSLDETRDLGVGLAHGQYLHDRKTGKNLIVFHDYRLLRPGAEFFDGPYTKIPPGFDASVNDLTAQGRLVSVAFWCPTPLKFSFDPNAVYENLPAAETCPDQGVYYD